MIGVLRNFPPRHLDPHPPIPNYLRIQHVYIRVKRSLYVLRCFVPNQPDLTNLPNQSTTTSKIFPRPQALVPSFRRASITRAPGGNTPFRPRFALHHAKLRSLRPIGPHAPNRAQRKSGTCGRQSSARLRSRLAGTPSPSYAAPRSPYRHRIACSFGARFATGDRNPTRLKVLAALAVRTLARSGLTSPDAQAPHLTSNHIPLEI